MVLINVLLWWHIAMLVTAVDDEDVAAAAVDGDATIGPPQSGEENMSDSSETLISTITSNSNIISTIDIDNGSSWTVDLLNCSWKNGELFFNTVYNYLYNIDIDGLTSSVRDQLRSVYHGPVSSFIDLIVKGHDSTDGENVLENDDDDDNNLSSRIKHVRSLLLRPETLAALAIIVALIIILILHRRNVINIPHPVAQHPALNNFVTKVFHYLNFTVLFSYMFATLHATFKGYFETQTIINQAHHGNAGAYSMQGRRPNMEDCFSLRNNVAAELGIDYYAVFDGHGGSNAALTAEKEIFESVSNRIKKLVPGSKTPGTNSEKDAKDDRFKPLTSAAMKTILTEEIINVDKRLVETFAKKGDISGTTALIAVRLLSTNELLVANVGDSRAIICDSKGATIPLSFDHKPYQLKEYRRILEAGGYISLKGVYRVNGILAISRALGDYPLKENRLIIPDPDIVSFDLKELCPKFMVLASDGFWDTFSNENAAQFVHQELARFTRSELIGTEKSTRALQIAKRLATEAYTRESYDNITVIFVLFDNSDDKCTATVAKSSPNRIPKKAIVRKQEPEKESELKPPGAQQSDSNSS